ncbi:YidH family protein [Isoptericola sediminis]
MPRWPGTPAPDPEATSTMPHENSSDERRDARRPRTERFPRWVYARGDEPDARFSLANERTLLAWIRTSLGLIAAGTALEALDLPMEPHLRLAAAVVLLLAGVAVPLVAAVEWARTERAMRLSGELPGATTGFLLVVTMAVVGVLLLLALLLR